MNQHGRLPDGVDSSDLFKMYKPNGELRDITYDYFEHYDICNEPIEYRGHINYDWGWQFWYYSHLDFSKILPLVRKYFTPNKEILDIVEKMEEKYGLTNNYDNICVLFHRGNDKQRETTLCEYSDIIQKSTEIKERTPGVRFLIQSDETEFIECFSETYPEHILFKDEIRHMGKCDNTVDKVFPENNYKFSKYFLAIVIIMSKCKHVVCGSGNISMWIAFFRGNMENFHQFFNGGWV
uniref:Uncharacterized protein n=1 Tax=viral metagenome TaxID=1070528 RepID=A0A6C0HI58_9ZZZZ